MRRLSFVVFCVLALASSVALAQARHLSVRMLGGTCGTHVERGAQPTATLRASADMRGRVTISLARFPFYCAPSPRFDARLREDGTLVLTTREPEPPVARCTCEHTVRLRVADVPPGVHPIEVRFRDETLARGEVGVANVRRPAGRE